MGGGQVVDKKLLIYGFKICRRFVLLRKCACYENINVAWCKWNLLSEIFWVAESSSPLVVIARGWGFKIICTICSMNILNCRDYKETYMCNSESDGREKIDGSTSSHCGSFRLNFLLVCLRFDEKYIPQRMLTTGVLITWMNYYGNILMLLFNLMIENKWKCEFLRT